MPKLRLLSRLSTFFTNLFGRFAWNSPPWIKWLQNKAVRQPRLFWSSLIGLVIIILLGSYAIHWYKSLPKPHLITAFITSPAITPNETVLTPKPLTIDFGTNIGSFTEKSVAPLKQIGKEISQGILMSPPLPGKWIWQSDSRLTFTPSEDWPADQTYQIKFSKSIFAPNIKLESLNYEFSTLPFEATIDEFKFYQDPVNPDLREAVATIHFNYSVNTRSFEKRTTLILQELKNDVLDLAAKQYKYNVTYDDHKRVAYLHSESLPITDVARYLMLTIDKGVKTQIGSGRTVEAISKNVLVPDAASYFKIQNVATSIVRNEQDRPEQVLTIETTLGVTDNELNKGLHVYLLPKDLPATSLEEVKENYAWQNPGRVTPAILKLTEPVDVRIIPSDRDYATLHSYQINVPPNRYLFVKIDNGIHGFGSYTLATNYTTVLNVPDYPKEIGFLHKGSLLALTGEKKLSVIVRGVPAVKFQFSRVLGEDITQLITQTGGKFDDPHFINYSFNQDNISEIFSEIRNFDTTDLAKAQYTALDFTKYLTAKANSNGPKGLFLLQANGWDTEKNIPLDVKTNRLILITDLGLIVKDNNDGSHDVFVQSITNGQPVYGVKVSVLGKNGLPILTRETDQQGRAQFPTLKDFIAEKEPVVYLANLGNDVSFIPYQNGDRQLNFSRFDTGGIYTNPDLQTLKAFIFSDRGIYRPGDTVHIGMIIKQAYVQPQSPGLPLEAIITDPRGTTLKDSKFILDETGYLNFDFHTLATSPTGQYTVNLYIVKDNHPGNLLGTMSVRVAEFLPDRMRITSHFSPLATKGWVHPDNLAAQIALWNLYGAPATDRTISAKLVLTPKQIQFNEYPQYIFVDPLSDPNKPAKVFTDTLADTKTNEKGEANFNLNLNRFDKATYELTFFAEGFEAEGGRSVATQNSVLVSPLTYFIGYKADGSLNYIKQNSQRIINFIAINSELKKQDVSNLKIKLFELHPITTLVKNPDGTFQYKSITQTSLVNTQSFNITKDSTNYTLPTEKVGDFAISIIGEQNTELSRFKFSVTGSNTAAIAKNAELSVKLNKTEYQSDEDIELQITSPYTGAGLITIERDKVYAVQWFKANATNSIQKIHIPKDFQGNGYINVTFVRDWNSPEIFINPLSYSIVPFTVTYKQHEMQISLSTAKVAKPGEPFTISYKSDKPGKVIIFAVDEGILQVTQFKTPNPLTFFFQKQALEVITQQTVDQILPKFIQERELSAVGGDEGEEALANHLNPFKRKTDLPVVYWSGLMDIDPTERQVIYQVPDYFNGSLRIMAVAVSSAAIGAAQNTAEIRGDFVINPNVPTFVAPNDEFEVTASIANNVSGSGQNALINVSLTVSPQLEMVSSPKQVIAIDEGREKTVRFKIRAKDTLGSATIIFNTQLNNRSGKMTSSLSVRPANNYFTLLNTGFSDKNKSLPVKQNVYPEYRQAQAMISSNPLFLLSGLQRYLDNFPFGCTEQLVSKAFPLLAAIKQPDFDKNLAEKKLQATIQMLAQRQMASGAFSYWPSVLNENNVFVSVYAMHFLTEARLQGYEIPEDVLQSGINYLKDLASKTPKSMQEARIQAYAIYVLTLNEIVTTNYLTNLQIFLDKYVKQWQQDLISAYLAATYHLLKNEPEAQKLISYFKPVGISDSNSDFYTTNLANAQYLYIVARYFPDYLNQHNKLILPLINAMNSNAINTILSSYISLAMSAYAQTHEAIAHAPLTINETLQDNKEKQLTTPDNTFGKAVIDSGAKKVNFITAEKQIYFYQLLQHGFDKKNPIEAIKNNIEIIHDYRDSTGNNIQKITIGDEIEIHIQTRSLNNNTLYNIAIVDLLPGGFEVVDGSFEKDSFDYVDVREDRIIFFTFVRPETREFVFRIKATNVGKFIIPAITAESMYDPTINAHGEVGSIEVTPKN